MTRDQLIECGRRLRALLTEWDAETLMLDRPGETVTCVRGDGLYYETTTGRLYVPEAAYVERYEVVA